MSGATHSGRCFCGQVRFQLSGKPMHACHCHCESCRRGSGSAFVTWVTFAGDGFVFASGTITEYRSSPGVRRGHCAACGTTLTYWSDKRPGEIDIALSSLDDASGIEPVAHIWVQDKVPWLSVNDDLPQYRTTMTAGDQIL